MASNFSENKIGIFKHNNPHAIISVENNELHIDKPWGALDGRLVFNINDDEVIQDINHITLDTRFDAIIHNDTNTIEFLFGYVSPDDINAKEYINRSFNFSFLGNNFLCSFSEPTQRLYVLAKAYNQLPSSDGISPVQQIFAFKYSQSLESISAKNREYFKNKVPRSFFVTSKNDNIKNLDLEQLSQHINFVLRYYDRRSPEIIIRSSDALVKDNNIHPIRFVNNEFPSHCAIRPIDEVILKLIEVAKQNTTRYAFVYYYQVFEYSAHYYIDDKSKKTITRILRDPSIINCTEDHISDLMSILIDMNHSDEAKMRKVIEEHCNPKILWKEIENDKEFFASKLIFEGGFELPSLIASDTTENTWESMWTPKLYDHLTKIRNCLVHAREKRESKVILPSKSNHQKIERYLPLIARMAEQIAICE